MHCQILGDHDKIAIAFFKAKIFHLQKNQAKKPSELYNKPCVAQCELCNWKAIRQNFGP